MSAEDRERAFSAADRLMREMGSTGYNNRAFTLEVAAWLAGEHPTYKPPLHDPRVEGSPFDGAKPIEDLDVLVDKDATADESDAFFAALRLRVSGVSGGQDQ